MVIGPWVYQQASKPKEDMILSLNTPMETYTFNCYNLCAKLQTLERSLGQRSLAAKLGKKDPRPSFFPKREYRKVYRADTQAGTAM